MSLLLRSMKTCSLAGAGDGAEDASEHFGAFGAAFGQMFKDGPSIPKPKKQVNRGNFAILGRIAVRQLVILGVFFFLMVAATFFLRQYDLLYSAFGSSIRSRLYRYKYHAFGLQNRDSACCALSCNGSSMRSA